MLGVNSASPAILDIERSESPMGAFAPENDAILPEVNKTRRCDPNETMSAYSDVFDPNDDVDTKMVSELPEAFAGTNLLSRSRSSTLSRSSRSSTASQSSSRKFNHFCEPSVLDRPKAMRSAYTAVAQKDVELLASIADKYGLPPMLRPKAWPLLLGSHPYVKAAVPPIDLLDTSEMPLKRIRGDIKRLLSRRKYPRHLSAFFEVEMYGAIVSFLEVWGLDISYETPMVWIAEFLLCGGANESVESLDDEPAGNDIAFVGIEPEMLPEVFKNIILVLTHVPAEFGEFISELRAIVPDLAQHFKTEGVLGGNMGGDVWLVWWLKWFGIRSLDADTRSRLWDEYFAYRGEPGQLSIMHQHLFNCIVIMKQNRGELLELDQSECRQFLFHVPPCRDPEAVVNDGRELAKKQESKDLNKRS